MPLIYQDLTAQNYKLGGTLEVQGNVDVTGGLELELSASVFTSRGVWTLMTWTGTLIGSAADVTLINSTAFSCPSRPYQDGNSFKVVLS